MAQIQIKVPDIGDFAEVSIIEMLVKVGDTVQAEQSLITVESDKASMEVPSSHAGVVQELHVSMGDKVKEGSVILTLQIADTGSAAVSAPAPAPAVAVVPVVAAAPAPVAAPAAASAVIDVVVPDIGDFDQVAVIELLVKAGDTVHAEQSLITVESDKASMEIPCSQAGVIESLTVAIGDNVSKGVVIARLRTAGASSASVAAAPVAAAPVAAAAVATPAPASASPAVAKVSAEVAVPAAAAAHTPGAPVLGLPHASPSVRKFARELGVDLTQIKGSAHKGRITAEDVQNHVKQALQRLASGAGAAGAEGFPGLLPWPKVDFAKFGPIERKEMSRIKKISGANLLRNAIMIPAVTNHDDADITDLEAFRVSTNKENEKSGVKVTMLAFLIKACVAALKKFPEFNSSLDGDALIYKQYFHIGFAADTPNGLMVPVIKDADKKGIFQISTEMSELAKKARDGKLSPAEMSGATFTISSLGGIGGRYFTPIINAPEVAILGVCKSQMEPVWNGKEFVPRLMLPLSLTWDHRVIDGAAAARFNVYLAQILSDFRRVML